MQSEGRSGFLAVLALLAWPAGAIDIDLSQAQVVKNGGTFHIDNVMVPGVSGFFGADLNWDGASNAFIPQNVSVDSTPVVCAFNYSANNTVGTIRIDRQGSALQLVVSGFTGASFDYHNLSVQGSFSDGTPVTILFANSPDGVTGQLVSTDPNDPYAIYAGFSGMTGAPAQEAGLLAGAQNWNGLAPTIEYGASYAATLTVAPNIDPTATFSYVGPIYITYATALGMYGGVQC